MSEDWPFSGSRLVLGKEKSLKPRTSPPRGLCFTAGLKFHRRDTESRLEFVTLHGVRVGVLQDQNGSS